MMLEKTERTIQRRVCGKISTIGRARRLSLLEAMDRLGIYSGAGLFLHALLVRDGCSQDELAARVFMDKASCARALRRLEDDGYVVRREVEHNRRMKSIHVTDKGRNVESDIVSAVESINDALLDGLSPEEIETLSTLLERVEANARRMHDKD